MIAASTPGAQRSRSNAITASAAAMIAQTPAAKPSTPSEKLTTFISATRPTTVIAPPALGKCRTPTKGRAISSTSMPKCTTISAAATCPASFTAGGSSKRSSSAPTRVITAEAISIPCQIRSSGSQISPATSVPAKIASPPSSGVGWSERPRSRGWSMAPAARARRIVNGVSRAVTVAAARKA